MAVPALAMQQVAGPPEGPNAFNRRISNKQAQWLSKENKCWHCYAGMPECREKRAAGNSRQCLSRGNEVPLKAGAHGGAPGWN